MGVSVEQAANLAILTAEYFPWEAYEKVVDVYCTGIDKAYASLCRPKNPSEASESPENKI